MTIYAYTADEREEAEQVERAEMEMTIPAILKPEKVLRLIEIDQKLYIMEMADRMTREEQDERWALLTERGKLRRGE